MRLFLIFKRRDFDGVADLGCQTNLNKKSFIGFGRDRTGVARDLFLVWCVLCLFSFAFYYYLSVASLLITTLDRRDTSEDSLQHLLNKVLSVNLHTFERVTISILHKKIHGYLL
ncbi:hypothetical protein VNO78_08322 [Psophocarpus tetragonolobus]|uniref:Uncharacterized protein n=1 Tax=Psophocarpus tetragonolobus TaxID=3891 RepID=A0AAN9T5F9_PSOTE